MVRYSITAKFIAVTMCTLMLLCAICSGLCIAALGATGMLSGKTVDELRLENAEEYLRLFAAEAVSIWAAGTYGEMPEELVDARMAICRGTYFTDDSVLLVISDSDGNELYSEFHGEPFTWLRSFTLTNVRYQHFIGYYESDVADKGSDTAGKYKTGFWSEKDDKLYEYFYDRENINEINASVYLNADALQDDPNFTILGRFAGKQTILLCMLVGGLFLFAVFAVYLCCVAGRDPNSTEIKADGLNKCPLDLYAAGLLGVFAVNMILLDRIGEDLIRIDAEAFLMAICAGGFFCCLAFVGFCFAFVAQLKTPNHYYLKNTLCGRLIRLMGKIVLFLIRQIPKLGVAFSAFYAFIKRILWDLCKVALAIWQISTKTFLKVLRFLVSIAKYCGNKLEHFFGMLPLLWQWLVIGLFLFGWLWIAVEKDSEQMQILWCCFALLLVLYGANSFGALLESTKKMRSGDLESKVEDKYLIGSFREFAGELNGLANVAITAAQNQMKSERMKSELITNVSHDIKTPLTSIINYVDLLKMPHTSEQEANYLEVLQRQSLRMKKLIDDLMELSKASTGNINVEITEIDASEAVTQALGEFTDKLDSAGITPVFYQPAESVILMADGRLLWRCMSNILSNAVKYAMSGTRLYVDISVVEQKAMITFKNISGTQLNISADELTERFVRGDSSRNTEGSGLGLNIAKNLMELQNGQLELLVDGDLFKVSLIFPIVS